jgi:4-diphosphocytidyl-2-C-methyl-D-erythritol kinase
MAKILSICKQKQDKQVRPEPTNAPQRCGVKIIAPAKINIFLEVINRRKDGYHNIESIMQTVSLFDEVTITPAIKNLTLRCDLKELPVDQSNLALKAAILLKNELKIDSGADIYLNKRIPLGAGLGGGSSDAAAVLKGLLRLWRQKLSTEKMLKIAERLGSDVPFFIYGGTAIARGKGEKLEKLNIKKPSNILIINPGFGVATEMVYKNLQFPLTKKQKINRILGLLKAQKPELQWGKGLFNRLEEVVMPRYPEIGRIKDVFKAHGCSCLMSGSGSTVFGVVPERKIGLKIKSIFESSGYRSWLVKTIP